MTAALKTIQFNTGAKYNAEGQIITATLYADGVVTFYDDARMIDGECDDRLVFASITGGDVVAAMGQGARPEAIRAHVERAYLRGIGGYRSTDRCRKDGLHRMGRNTRDGFDLMAKLAALPTQEAMEAMHITQLTQVWAEFCEAFEFVPQSADEILALVAADKRGTAWESVRTWIIDFITEWERNDDDASAGDHYRVPGDGVVELGAFPTETQARDFVRGYTRSGDWGGYGLIQITSAVTGESWTFDAPEAAA